MSGSAYRGWVSAFMPVAWAMPITLCINDLVGGPAHVQGGSMQPTLNPPGAASSDIVLVQRWGIRLYKYRRGDVVILRSPSSPDERIVKRLIALEGDWLTIPGRYDIEKIPKGHCWVEGDNSSTSEDSLSKHGSIPVALVEGRVSHILWPPSRIGQVASHMPSGRSLARNEAAFKNDDSLY